MRSAFDRKYLQGLQKGAEILFVIENDRLIACSTEPAGQIVIPDTVTAIGSRAFENRTSLTEVVLPPLVKTIGDAAFAGCSMLTSVSLHDGLKRLGKGCFRNCINLRQVQLPDTVTSIHPGVFQGCTQLVSIRLSKGLRRNIEGGTFAACTTLESIVIPRGIQQVKSGAFAGCTSLRHVTFENDDVQIEREAFRGCQQLSEESLALIRQHIIDTSVIDIKSRAAGAVGRLSNYTGRRFTFDGVACGSIEGVLQSFKCPDPQKQAEICALSGGMAKQAGSGYAWKEEQLLYWQGVTLSRHGQAYQELVDRLYLAVYDQDEGFRRDLAAMRGKKIDHRMGQSDPSETILTRQEFVSRLQRLSEGTLQLPEDNP